MKNTLITLGINLQNSLIPNGSLIGILHFWAGYYCKCMKLLDPLKLLEAVGMDSSFPMRCSMRHLDSQFKSYGVLKISALLWAGS